MRKGTTRGNPQQLTAQQRLENLSERRTAQREIIAKCNKNIGKLNPKDKTISLLSRKKISLLSRKIKSAEKNITLINNQIKGTETEIQAFATAQKRAEARNAAAAPTPAAAAPKPAAARRTKPAPTPTPAAATPKPAAAAPTPAAATPTPAPAVVNDSAELERDLADLTELTALQDEIDRDMKSELGGVIDIIRQSDDLIAEMSVHAGDMPTSGIQQGDVGDYFRDKANELNDPHLLADYEALSAAAVPAEPAAASVAAPEPAAAPESPVNANADDELLDKSFNEVFEADGETPAPPVDGGVDADADFDDGMEAEEKAQPAQTMSYDELLEDVLNEFFETKETARLPQDMSEAELEAALLEEPSLNEEGTVTVPNPGAGRELDDVYVDFVNKKLDDAHGNNERFDAEHFTSNPPILGTRDHNGEDIQVMLYQFRTQEEGQEFHDAMKAKYPEKADMFDEMNPQYADKKSLEAPAQETPVAATPPAAVPAAEGHHDSAAASSSPAASSPGETKAADQRLKEPGSRNTDLGAGRGEPSGPGGNTPKPGG
ncbi:MAG: hypothetical protein P1U63_05780 [Coxiellaceae bacterium]|nr:hypothetical protein [Coxiellaceae bacterium]